MFGLPLKTSMVKPSKLPFTPLNNIKCAMSVRD